MTDPVLTDDQCRSWMSEGRTRVRTARRSWMAGRGNGEMAAARDWWYARWHQCGRALGPERINQINDEVGAAEAVTAD